MHKLADGVAHVVNHPLSGAIVNVVFVYSAIWVTVGTFILIVAILGGGPSHEVRLVMSRVALWSLAPVFLVALTVLIAMFVLAVEAVMVSVGRDDAF